MIFRASLQKLVNDHAFINDVNDEITNCELTVAVLQFARIRNDCGMAFGSKILLQNAKLAFSRDAFPINDGDLGVLFVATPLAVCLK